MKKISTAAARQVENFSQQTLTIGLDLGDRWSYYCVLNEGGHAVIESKVTTSPNAMEGVLGGMQSDSAGNRDAFAVGKSAVEQAWARSDRGTCSQCALDRGEPAQR